MTTVDDKGGGQAEINSNAIDLNLIGVILNLRRKLSEPGFDLMKMAYETGIDHQALYNFKRGATNNPRVETLDKMISYLMPEVRIVEVQMKPAAE